jgi:hypothetical protein
MVAYWLDQPRPPVRAGQMRDNRLSRSENADLVLRRSPTLEFGI